MKVEAPGAARSTAAAVQPQPFAPDRLAAAQAIANVLGTTANASVVWLADGIDHDDATRAFADRLKGLAGAGFAVVETRPGQEALGASATVSAAGASRRRCCVPGGHWRVLHLSGRRRLGGALRARCRRTRAVVSFDLPLARNR